MPCPRSSASAARASNATSALLPAAAPHRGDSEQSTPFGGTSVCGREPESGNLDEIRATDPIDSVPVATWLQELERTALNPVLPVLKNTFLEYTGLRTPSLDEWIKERECRSCPVSARIEFNEIISRQQSFETFSGASPAGELAEEAKGLAPALPDFNDIVARFVESGQHLAYMAKLDEAVTEPVLALPEFHEIACHQVEMAVASPWGEAQFAPSFSAADHWPVQDEGCVLRLADALGTQIGVDVQLPPPEQQCLAADPCVASLPSVGSVGHHVGQCKPCAFIEKGCANGHACPFCHLCDAEALRRLKKEKTRWRKMCRDQRRSLSSWETEGDLGW